MTNQLLTDLKIFFQEDGWGVSEIDAFPALSLPFRARNAEWLCYAQAREEQNIFLFYSVCPIRVPEVRRATMAEFVVRANFGLLVGNFEMDFKDGELRCKTAVAMDNIHLTSELIRPIVYINVLTMEHYLAGIMTVIQGNGSPAEAIDDVEQHA